jgi:hypothetical protein
MRKTDVFFRNTDTEGLKMTEEREGEERRHRKMGRRRRNRRDRK